MLSIKNKVSTMDIEKLKKHEIIAKRIEMTELVIIGALFMAFLLTGALHIEKACAICVIGLLLSSFVWWFLDNNYRTIHWELIKRKKLDLLLFETERQVKIKPGYDGFPDTFLFRSLLEGATITARINKEAGKVILRFEMVDDEGKTFSKTLELDEDRIIYDLEIL